MDDAPGLVDPHDPEPRRLLGRHVLHGNGGVGTRLTVGSQHVAEIHPVELIAGEDHDVVPLLGPDVAHAAPHGIGGALEPIGALLGLLRGHHRHEPRRENVELVGVGDVLVQALRLVLGQHVDPPDLRMQAIAHRHVDDPVVAPDGYGRL